MLFYGTGFLLRWAQQGVLLLNATLTVREGHKEAGQSSSVHLESHKCFKKTSSRPLTEGSLLPCLSLKQTRSNKQLAPNV